MSRIVVNGATGELGRLIVGELAKRIPLHDLTLVSRSPERLTAWADRGARVCYGDYRDPASLEAAYAGGDALMLISGLAILKRIPEHRNAIAAAKKAGIKHIVYTSVSGVHPCNRTPSCSDHIVTERDLRESGLGFTALRNQAYMELMTEMAQIPLQTGKWFHVGDKGKFSPVSRADIALSAATILLEPERHAGVVYEITGPELLTFRDLAQRFSALYEIPIEYIPVSAEEMFAKFDEWGVPRVGIPEAPVPACYGSNELVENYVAWEQQFHAILSHHVELITGRQPATLHEIMVAGKNARKPAVSRVS